MKALENNRKDGQTATNATFHWKGTSANGATDELNMVIPSDTLVDIVERALTVFIEQLDLERDDRDGQDGDDEEPAIVVEFTYEGWRIGYYSGTGRIEYEDVAGNKHVEEDIYSLHDALEAVSCWCTEGVTSEDIVDTIKQRVLPAIFPPGDEPAATPPPAPSEPSESEGDLHMVPEGDLTRR